MKHWLWAAVALVGCGSQMTETDAGIPYVAPRVVTKTPESLRVVIQPGRCGSQPKFSLAVEAMPSATLRTQWFFDEGVAFMSIASAPTASPRSIEQPESDAFVVTLGNLPFGTHTLSAHVTDGEFIEGFPGQDEAVWVLDVQPCP